MSAPQIRPCLWKPERDSYHLSVEVVNAQAAADETDNEGQGVVADVDDKGALIRFSVPSVNGRVRARATSGISKLYSDALLEVYRENRQLRAALKENEDRCQELASNLALARQQAFGTSSEKVVPAEAVDVADADALNAVDGLKTPQKARRGSPSAGRKPLPEHLEREDVRLELGSDLQICESCNGPLVKVGVDVTEQLVSIPQQFKVQRTSRAKYLCRCCNRFTTAPAPKSLIPGHSYGSPEFVSDVAISKYRYGMPLYRQADQLASRGLEVSSATLANLMIGGSEGLERLSGSMLQVLLGQSEIHGDETSTQVLNEPGRAPQTQSFMWAFRSSAKADRQVVYFAYRQTRAGSNAAEILTDISGKPYTGRLHVDGYAGYNKLPAVRVACMAHIRRKFIEAQLVAGPQHKEATLAAEVVELIRQLYSVEAEIADLPAEQFLAVRRSRAGPILKTIEDWLDRHKDSVLPKSRLGRAIRYAIDQWPAMARYLDTYQSAIDNNVIEREIKSYVIGRKAWLFSVSEAGARANALWHTLIQSAVANGIDPYRYLVKIITDLPNTPDGDDLQSLMPWYLRGKL